MDPNYNLLSVFKSLTRWAKQIIIGTAIIGVISIIVSLLVPVYYTASTSFYAASPDLASPERVFGTSNESLKYYGTDMDIDRLISISQSSILKRYLIDSFDLMEHYDIDQENPKAAFLVSEHLEDLYKVKKNKLDAINLTVEDQDKVLAADMANAARDEIDRLAQELIKTTQAEMLNTYEISLREKSRQLDIIGDSLQRLRREYSVYNVETQGEQLTTLATEVETLLEREKARLGAFKKMENAKDSVYIIEANIKSYKEQYKILQSKIDNYAKGVSKVSVLTEIQERTSSAYGRDRERYKQAQAAFSQPFKTLHLLERAEVPIVKSRPIRSLLVLLSSAIGFFFLCVGAILFDAYQKINWKEVE